MLPEFSEFPKIYRLSRECVITEKIDGTNASIYIEEDGTFTAGSRTRWITPQDDNFGFARWAEEHKVELMSLGPGQHFGEWWGVKIQRGYNLKEKRFSLINTSRWEDPSTRPLCCGVVPVMYKGLFTTEAVERCLDTLRVNGSLASPGFMKPEGIVVYHIAGNVAFKKTLEKDEEHKSQRKRE